MPIKTSTNNVHHQQLFTNNTSTNLAQGYDALMCHDQHITNSLAPNVRYLLVIHAATTWSNATDCSTKQNERVKSGINTEMHCGHTPVPLQNVSKLP